MKFARYSIALFALLLGASLAFADERPSLIIGYYDFPPSIYAGDDDQPRGEMVDLARRIIERAGYAPVFRHLPSARLYAALRDGSVDVWPGVPGKSELVPFTLAGREEITTVFLNLYFRSDTLPPRIPDDLAGRGLIVLNGYNYIPQVAEVLHAPGVRLHQATSHASALQMLLHRRGDFLLDYELPANVARAEIGLAPLPFVQMHRLPIHFIASRAAPDAAQKLEALDRAFAAMLAAGESVGVMRR